jgi:putative oxygen-independent coproporphyrinogen III oxidase
MAETYSRAAAPAPADLALYVHWPFCLSKCPYCDFNSHVRETIDQAGWRDALLGDLEHEIAALPGRRLTSIFFGGGTPSLMDPATAGRIIARALDAWPSAAPVEITLEANPTSVEAAKLRDFHEVGVNRLSLGVQALDDTALKFLGRGHSAAEALAAVETARGIFDRLSFDLIYARPGQSVADWRAELTRALGFAADHLSVYQLTIERGTAFFAAWRDKAFSLPDEDTAADLYETTQAILEEAGMPAYEISNHAKPGGESRHNLTYWRYGDYAGIGPGAHGRAYGDLGNGDGKWAVRRIANPENWRAQVAERGHGIQERDLLPAQEIFREMLLMGLRLRDGLLLSEIERQTGAPFEHWTDTATFAMLAEAGLIACGGGVLRATAEGRQRLNAVTARLAG